MASIKWNEPGTRKFETGVDRCVLYSLDGLPVAWNGVTQITEKTEGASVTPKYIDGVKFIETRVYGDFAATIEAFSAPREFGNHDGTAYDVQGIGFGLQPVKPFHFSYRTLVGDDSSRDNTDYRIHVIFKAFAQPSDRDYATISSDISLTTFSWDITTIPSRVVGRRPTSHLIFDSRVLPPATMSFVEDHIYGGEGELGRLTTMQALVDDVTNFQSNLTGIFTPNVGQYF